MSFTSTVAFTGPVLVASLPQTTAVGFPFNAGADLLVLDTGPTSSPYDPAHVLTLGSDFTVVGGGYNSANQMQTGSIVLVSGGANNVQVNDYIIIQRGLSLNQPSSFEATGPLTIALVEQAIDKAETAVQQVNQLLTQALHFENWATVTVANIAALRTTGTAATANGTYVQTAGYYSANDGAAGLYVWNSTSTTTDNGGTIIQVTGLTTGRWLLEYSGAINVKSFGAYGNGTTDDTTAIQNALTAATAGTIVLFPAANYKFSTLNVPNGVTLLGGGWYANNFQIAFGGSWAGTITGTVLISTATSGSAISFAGSGLVKCGLRDLALLGPGSGTSVGFTYGSGSYAVQGGGFSNVLFANFYTGMSWLNAYENVSTGLVFAGCTNGWILGLNTNANDCGSVTCWYTGALGVQINNAVSNRFGIITVEDYTGDALQLVSSYGNKIAGFYSEGVSTSTNAINLSNSTSSYNVFDVVSCGTSYDVVNVAGNQNKFLSLAESAGAWTFAANVGGNLVIGHIVGGYTDNNGGNIFWDTYGGTLAQNNGLTFTGPLTAGSTLSVSNKGTFTLSSGSVSLTGLTLTANTVMIPWLKTASGTIAGNPYASAISAGSGTMTVKGGASDNSTYNYILIN